MSPRPVVVDVVRAPFGKARTVPMRTNRMGRDDTGPRFRARFGDTLVGQGIVIPATHKLLARHHLVPTDIDLYEVSEAFAGVVPAWAREIGVESDRINVDGGAIAYGHPVGASGAGCSRQSSTTSLDPVTGVRS